MASQKPQFLPPFPSEKSIERSRKFALRNDVLLWLQESNLGWSRDFAFSVGAAFVTALTDSLWYIDGHMATLDGRACTVPQEFRRFQGYNQPEKNKHRKRIVENLNCTSLDLYSSILNNFVLQPWLNTSVWKSIRTAVCGLAESLAYLKEKIQRNHEKVVPVRSNSNAEELYSN